MKKNALKAFKAAQKIDKHSPITNKHLNKLKQNKSIQAPAFSQSQFIEEPGKTKTTFLHRLASKKILEKISVGKAGKLISKNRYISIEVDGEYVGALPEDLSFRLTKLMKTGNSYDCFIKSLNENECSVFLKETDRSKRNLNTNSFCITKTTHTTHLDSLDENYLDQETVPVVIISTDEDSDGSEKINSEIKSIAKDGNSLT